jgi:hypothetical protein
MINKSKKTDCLIYFAVILMIAFLVLLIPTGKTGPTDEKSTPSNATVSVFVEVTLSSDLAAGISFGNVDQNSNDNNATANNFTLGASGYIVTAGAANSVNIDLCIKDSVALTKTPDTIPNTGYTYNFTATTNASTPDLPGTVITTDYVKTQHTNIAANGKSYSRFWLDIPAVQTAGTYNNTVYIKGIETGGSC